MSLAGHEAQELQQVTEAVTTVPGCQDVVETVHDGEVVNTVSPGS